MWNDDSSSRNQGRNQSWEGQPPKQLERLKVSSGCALIIDQFMLGNSQFTAQLPKLDSVPSSLSASELAEIQSAALRYGGAAIAVESGDWAVLRDPNEHLFIFAMMRDGDEELLSAQEEVNEARGNAKAVSRVFVDTRCLVFIDAAKMFEPGFLDEYRSLRESKQDKAARDFLRQHGAAVRYGFNRDGDELGVFITAEKTCIALWPDVVDDAYPADSGAEAAIE